LPSLPGAGRRTWPKPKAKAKAAAAVTDALDDGIAADAEKRWQTTWYTRLYQRSCSHQDSSLNRTNCQTKLLLF